MPGRAPLDLEPVEPMLASRPALASGDSVEMKESTEDWARARRGARRRVKEVLKRTMALDER